jgi:hypothetical protein
MLEILNDRPMENMGQLDGNTWTLVFACFLNEMLPKFYPD